MSTTVSDEMVVNILTSAFEGGILYWATQVEVLGVWPEGAEYAADVPTRGGALRIHVDGDHPHKLDLKAIQYGIRAEAKAQDLSVEDFYEKHDAGDADNAVQRALFGELVYA